MHLYCRVHPPPTSGPGSWFIGQSEIDDVCKQSVGVPVCIEHDPTRVVGCVEKVWASPTDGWLCARARIEDPKAAAMVMDGELTELAMNMTAERCPGTGARLGGYNIVSIDLVRRSCFDQKLEVMPQPSTTTPRVGECDEQVLNKE